MSHDKSTPASTKSLCSPFAVFAKFAGHQQNHADRRHHTEPADLIQEIRNLKRAKYRLKTRCTHLKGMVGELQSVCNHDPLTGVYNRRGLTSAYQKLSQQAVIPGRGHVLVFVDGDGFGQINKIYGDGVGDRVIQEIAGALRRYTRRTDIVARKGGDEFIVILKNIGPHDIEKIITGPRGLQRRLNQNTYITVGETILPIKASMGAAFFTSDEDLDTVLQRADQGMRGQKLYQKAIKLWTQAAV